MSHKFQHDIDLFMKLNKKKKEKYLNKLWIKMFEMKETISNMENSGYDCYDSRNDYDMGMGDYPCHH